jgi:hypothetical protein
LPMSEIDPAPLDDRAAVLEALACDITARPADAPHFAEVTDHLLAVRREPGALLADFDAAAAPTLERIVEAERRCCPEIGWHLERVTNAGSGHTSAVRLRIEGSETQVAAAALLIGREA